jgi:hypothetical protein
VTCDRLSMPSSRASGGIGRSRPSRCRSASDARRSARLRRGDHSRSRQRPPPVCCLGQLVHIAEAAGAVIRLAHRPGHFVVAGRPLGTVWPPDTAPGIEEAPARSHVTGPHRTLVQDPVFAIDQLVEIATFTALTCIDWLSAALADLGTGAFGGHLQGPGGTDPPDPARPQPMNAWWTGRSTRSGKPAGECLRS